MEPDSIRHPTDSELTSIMTHLRMDVIERQGEEPKKVRLAKTHEEREAAWKNEALRFYYLAVMPRLSVKRRLILTQEELEATDHSPYYDSVDDLLTGG